MSLKVFRRTVITGAILLVPIFALLYFSIRVFAVTKDAVRPVMDLLEIDRFAGFILLNLVALGLLGLLCFLAGLAARMSYIVHRVDALDRKLAKRVPGYSIIVSVIRGAVDDDLFVDKLKTVVVSTGGGHRLGFEVERSSSGDVVVFLPNVPNAQTGIAMSFPPDDVQQVAVPAHRIFEMLQFFGKGVAGVVAQARAEGAQRRSDAEKTPTAEGHR